MWFVLHIVISLEDSTLLFNHDFGMSLVMGNVIFLFSLPSELERATRVKSSSALSQFFQGKKGCLFHHHHKLGKAAFTVFENHKKVSFFIACEAFYFYILRRQKLWKMSKKSIWWIFEKLQLAAKTVPKQVIFERTKFVEKCQKIQVRQFAWFSNNGTRRCTS